MALGIYGHFGRGAIPGGRGSHLKTANSLGGINPLGIIS